MEIFAYHVQFMSFLLALICYNASLQINIVPHCKDWSIFCFDLADDLVPCKWWGPKWWDACSIKRPRCKNGQHWCLNYRRGRKANRSNRFEYWAVWLFYHDTGNPNSVGFEFTRDCMKINKIRPKFRFLTIIEKRNLGHILLIFIHSLVNSKSNELPQSLGCLWFLAE